VQIDVSGGLHDAALRKEAARHVGLGEALGLEHDRRGGDRLARRAAIGSAPSGSACGCTRRAGRRSTSRSSPVRPHVRAASPPTR
jgi:hypothetical protein